MLTEASELGRGFLADVCRAWEAATRAGVRVADSKEDLEQRRAELRRVREAGK